MRRIILSATIWLLLLSNLAYFVWAHGALAPLGFGKSDLGEPQRIQRQILPERILLSPTEGAPVAPAAPAASAASGELAPTLAANQAPTAVAIDQLMRTPAPAPVVVSSVSASAAASGASLVATAAPANSNPQCLQSQALDGKLLNDVRRLLEGQWPSGTWKINSINKPGRWMIYMGKYPNKAALEKKQSELKNMKVPFHLVKDPDLSPGLSLGEYDSQARANQALQSLAKLGVRTARVIQETASGVSHIAVISAYTPKLQPLLNTLQTRLGSAMRACDKALLH